MAMTPETVQAMRQLRDTLAADANHHRELYKHHRDLADQHQQEAGRFIQLLNDMDGQIASAEAEAREASR